MVLRSQQTAAQQCGTGDGKMDVVVMRSLKLRLLIYMVPAALLLLALLYLGFHFVVNSAVTGIAQDFTEQKVRLNEEKFSGIIRQELMLSRMLVTTPELIRWALDEKNPDLKSQALARLDHYRTAFRDRNYFFVVDQSQHYYFSEGNPSKQRNLRTKTLSPTEPHDAWYYATKKAGRQCQINIGYNAMIDATKVWINCLLQHDGVVVGVAGTGMDLSSFIRAVVNDNQPGVTNLYINRQGAIQVAPDSDNIDLNSLTHHVPDSKTVFAFFNRAQDRQTFAAILHQLQNDDQSVHTMQAVIHGSSYIIGITGIKKSDWYNVTIVDIDHLLMQQMFFPFALLTGLALLLLLALLVFFVNRLVLARIHRLDVKVRQVQAGEYVISHSDTTPDEIGRLDEGFAAMAAAVHEHATHLEAKVAARTAELEAATQEAQAANKSKSEFLSVMSHEIRTPMNAIIGMTHLAMRTELTPQQSDYLTKAHYAANALLGIINDILDFSKIEAGKMTLESIPFNLKEVLNNLTTMSGIRAHEKGLEIYFEQDEDVPCHLIGDPLRLGQVLLNLINNALKFTEQGEVMVHIRTMNEGEGHVQLEFSVEDTGIGLSQTQIGKLFESFSQADASITRKYGGTGLGLAICKQLVELMEGAIRVESELGVGSRFIFFASFGVQAQQQEELFPIPESLRGFRVLVVDDSATSRRVMQHYLEAFSMQVTSAVCGEEALAMLDPSNEPYQLVLMDWKMPGIDGIETSRRIKNHPSLESMPTVIMVTAYGRDEVMQQAEIAKLDGFLIKPVEKSVLYRVIMDTFGYGDADSVSQHNDEADNLNALQGAQVLVVEDNPINQQIACEILEQAGLVVAVANNGHEAVEMVANAPFDAVLMDLQMPKMDGYEATRLIREDGRFADLPIIAMTAHAMDEEREKCLAAGMNGHTAKPIDLNKLFELLRQWIEPIDRPSAVTTMAAIVDVQPLPAQLPGIDLTVCLQKLGGNHSLLRSLLQEFVQEFVDYETILRARLEQGDTEAVKRMTHTIRGIAGNLAAIPLYQAAGRLEQAIVIREKKVWTELLDVFAACLQEVRDSIASLGQEEVETAPDSEGDSEAADRLLFELEGLIKIQSMDADQVFVQLKVALPTHAVDETMLALESALNRFDFAAAHQALCEIRQQIAAQPT